MLMETLRLSGKKIITGLFIIVLLSLTGFTVWAYKPPKPMTLALEAMQSTSNVTVTNAKWITFNPNNPQSTALIFYPGGRVDPRSYAPLAFNIAAQGYPTIIPKMPFNLAVFGKNTAKQIVKQHQR